MAENEMYRELCHRKDLHRGLDELLAAYLEEHQDKRPSNISLMELLLWSAERSEEIPTTKSQCSLSYKKYP